MVTKEHICNDFNDCPITATMEVIGGKWKPVILYNLLSGTRRFGEIAVRIPTISRKVLTEQLKEMERDGLVIREQYEEIPPRVEYSLTDKSRSLTSVFKEIADWGNENLLATRPPDPGDKQ
ncbi:winged helix-turn-helix transcriptional regulator [Chitinophaga ginsengisoli]|nr:helix-turn-helix domain-containing protein [Chitinophaga ginsengisoli]